MSATYNYKHFVSGVLGGTVSTSILHPLDLIKIRFSAIYAQEIVAEWLVGTLEVESLNSRSLLKSLSDLSIPISDGLSSRPKYSSMWNLAKSVWRKQGVRGLYAGVLPNFIGNGLSWGLYFFYYNSIKSYLNDGNPSQPLAVSQYLCCGVISGALTLVVTNPVWMTKTRLCLQYETQQTAYRGMWHALRDVYQRNGIRGLYKGFVPGLIGTSHGAVQFLVYEKLKLWNANRKGINVNHKMDTFDILMMSSISKLVAASSTYPYQVVRARLQEQHRAYNGVLDAVVSTARNEGWRGFYKGLVPNLVRVVPACCITFYTYETAMYYLPDSYGTIAKTGHSS